MGSTKEAIVLVLDVGPLMIDGPEGSETALSKSLEAINMILQRKIFSQSKDEVALIAFGTEETKNPLAESLGGYENISIIHKLESPSIEFIRTVKDDISVGTASADFVDAIVVAMDHVMEKTRGRKMEQRIVLFSNLASDFSTDNLEAVVESMKKANVRMTFIGPEIEDEDDQGSDSEDNRQERRGNGGTQEQKPLSTQQLEGIKCMKGVLEQLDAEGMSFADVLSMLSFFQSRSVKQTTTFRGPIEIGDAVKINVYGYVKVKESKPASFKKMSALSEASKNPGDMKVSMQRSHHLQDEDFTEVDDEHVAKAYKYGKTLVPYSKIDEQSLKMQTERCLKVLGFTDRSNIDESHFLGDSAYIFVPQPGDKDAAVALSALVHALEEKNMVAIVRYCRCKNANPKLAVLVPEIKFHYEGFYMFFLPFAEDIRRFSFAPLEPVVVTDEQANAIDSIIDGMDLTKAQTNADGDESEAFKPKNILNPAIQRQCQCIQKRALNPEDESIPKIDGYIKRSIEVLPEHAANCKPIIDKLKGLFPLTVVDKKGAKRNQNVFQQSAERLEAESKKAKVADENADETDFRFSSLLQTTITEVGTANPVQDYDTLIRNSDPQAFLNASNQIASRILQFVNDSFLDQYYQKALESLKKLREESIKADNPDVFNELMDRIKKTMLGHRRHDFWKIVKSEKLNMISKAECSNSRVNDDIIQQFFGEEEDKKMPEESHVPVEEDVDELLDMM